MTAVLDRPTSPQTPKTTPRRSITDPTLTTAEYNRALHAYLRSRSNSTNPIGM